MSELNPKTLVSVHCYQGDAEQVRINLRLYEHHQCPVVIVSPENSKVTGIGPHWSIWAGEVGYVGMHTIRRQSYQLQALINLPGNFDWFLMNDSDSFCITPKLPNYLYEDQNVIYSNLVPDFRIPGQTSHGVTWPKDYHAGYVQLVASQPPYWAHRRALEKIIPQLLNVQDDGITPFIDWGMAAAPQLAGVPMKRFHGCASCETQTPLGRAVMSENVERGATFVHAIKTREGLNAVLAARAKRLATHPHER